MKIDWKPIVGKYLKILISSFIAGLLISISGLIYLGCAGYIGVNGNLVGGLLSTTGLLLICLYGYNLFTFKFGYIVENKIIYVLELFFTLVGNYLGTLIMSLIMRGTDLMKDGTNFMNALNSYMVNRENENILSILILSLICGILIYFAYNTYKKAEQPIARFLTLIVIGTVIVIANLEHGMFDMFMYSLYKPFDGGLTVKVIYMIMANCLGTIIVPLLNKLRSKIKSI
jgi:formate/nitrite transporter FocA (FNT family)